MKKVQAKMSVPGADENHLSTKINACPLHTLTYQDPFHTLTYQRTDEQYGKQVLFYDDCINSFFKILKYRPF